MKVKVKGALGIALGIALDRAVWWMCALVGSAQRSIESAQCKALMIALEIAHKRTRRPTTGPLGVALRPHKISKAERTPTAHREHAGIAQSAPSEYAGIARDSPSASQSA